MTEDQTTHTTAGSDSSPAFSSVLSHSPFSFKRRESKKANLNQRMFSRNEIVPSSFYPFLSPNPFLFFSFHFPFPLLLYFDLNLIMLVEAKKTLGREELIQLVTDASWKSDCELFDSLQKQLSPEKNIPLNKVLFGEKIGTKSTASVYHGMTQFQFDTK